MSEIKTEESGAPKIKDQRIVPPGILPKNMQTVVVSGIALVMVGVIAFSGRNAPKPRAVRPLPTSAPIDPNQMRIEEYKKRIEEQTRKLQLEQAALARNQEALAADASNNAIPDRSYRAPIGGYSYSSGGTSTRNPIQSDRTKREFDSLFASNVALTYRKDTSAAEPALSPENFAKLISFYPALAAMQSAAFPGVGTPKPQIPTASNDGALPKVENPSVSGVTSESSDPKEPKYRLFEGTVLETVLTNRLDGAFSGPVNCMVTTNVYSRDGQHLLIPQGSRILGEARKVEAFGQTRLAVAFHRLILPNGFWITLDQFKGLNQIGETGLSDQINHHYLQVFGVSLAIGAIAGLGQANTRTGVDPTPLDAYEQGVTTSLSQSSLHILDRYLNVLPTITIREGQRVKVLLSGDLLLPAYDMNRS